MINKDKLIKLYPNTPNKVLAAMFNTSVNAVGLFAARNGIKKSSEYKSQVQKANATGKTKSKSTRKKIADKRKGIKLTEETKAKILKTKIERNTIPKGSSHYKWKGGKTWERFKNPLYQEWRSLVLNRDDFTCQSCGKHCNKNEKGLAAHHIKEYAKYPELRYDINNGLTLCRKCHMELHGKPIQEAPMIPCACGCGTMLKPKDKYGRNRRYINHHAKKIHKNN